MKNHYVSHFNLPSLSQLTSQRIQSISPLINKLKFKDVEEDKIFEETKQKIKAAILFKPLSIEEPVFVDYDYEEIPVRFEQQIFGHVGKDHYYHTVTYKYTGDKELFMHTPDRFSYSSSDHGIIEPSKNSIKVIVDLQEINPEKAKAEANSLVNLTKNIGETNSLSIIPWNTAVEKRIDDEMEAKRNELFKIFGTGK